MTNIIISLLFRQSFYLFKKYFKHEFLRIYVRLSLFYAKTTEQLCIKFNIKIDLRFGKTHGLLFIPKTRVTSLAEADNLYKIKHDKI